LASKAARCRLAAGGKADLVEFGFRRTHGIEAGVLGARCAALVGFRGTSNMEASRRFGLTPSGTMAHSYVETFPTQIDAFRAFATDLPGQAIFLVDTYDTESGVHDAATVIAELGLEDRAGIRIDSGDLIEESHKARARLDEAGLTRVRIYVSGGLDEHDVARLVASGAPIDAFGIGTKLGVSADAPVLDSAYKLVAYAGEPAMKLSAGKVSLPGAKQVFRRPGMSDCLGLADEPVPPGAEALLQPVMAQGARLFPSGTASTALDEARWRFEADLEQLPDELRALEPGPAPAVEHTEALRSLTDEVTARLRGGRPG
ncbi:MAG TPA: nicotinate phosphoribosyltransferase, partial [Acidimicrobiales bacterium]|nr:nicotinate phosphoribosyltransferase [Acidimicrobiales bacterium]